jgi:hypothetical protein
MEPGKPEKSGIGKGLADESLRGESLLSDDQR